MEHGCDDRMTMTVGNGYKWGLVLENVCQFVKSMLTSTYPIIVDIRRDTSSVKGRRGRSIISAFISHCPITIILWHVMSHDFCTLCCIKMSCFVAFGTGALRSIPIQVRVQTLLHRNYEDVTKRSNWVETKLFGRVRLSFIHCRAVSVGKKTVIITSREVITTQCLY